MRTLNWTVSRRLYALLSVVCLALAAVSAAAIHGADDMAFSGRTLYQDAIPGFEHGSQLALLFERQRGLVARVPGELDLTRQTAFHDEFKGNVELIGKALATLAEAGGDARTMVERVTGDLKPLNDAAGKVFEFGASFAQEQATQVLNSDYAKAETAITKSIETLFAANREKATLAAASLADAHGTLRLVVSGAAATSMIGVLAFGVVMVRRLTRRIDRLTGAMARLADRDLGAEIPGASERDEIGRMASAVEVFKDSMIKGAALDRTRRADEEAKLARTSLVASLTQEFGHAIDGVVQGVSSAATQLQANAQSLTVAADGASRQATAVASASEEASSNVQTVAAATEELSASIAEIGRQVAESARVAGQAVADAGRTNGQVQALAEAAQKIGAVVKLIADIAGQTNLLALNATIEAARAGEAGKGFAVVAGEVKSLASQTAKATEEIAAQVNAIQQATGGAVQAIGHISETIAQVNSITTAIAAAVEQQGAATQEIARNVQQASLGTTAVSSNIAGVTRAAGDTGSAASDVLAATGELNRQSEALRQQVDSFLSRIRAA